MKKILQDLLMILLCPVQGPWASSVPHVLLSVLNVHVSVCKHGIYVCQNFVNLDFDPNC